MASDEEYEASIKAAEQELMNAQSADDVREVWRRHTGSLGHRTLGRLLLGQPAEKLLDRRADRQA